MLCRVSCFFQRNQKHKLLIPLDSLLIVNSLDWSIVLCKTDFFLNSLNFTQGMDFTPALSWDTFYTGHSPLFPLSLAHAAWSWSSFLVTSASWKAVQGSKVLFWGPILWSCSGTLIKDRDKTTYVGQSPATCLFLFIQQ